MRLARPLEWPREVAAAREQQLRLAAEVRSFHSPAPPLTGWRLVAGLDVSYSKRRGRVYAALVVLDADNRLVEEAVGEAPLDFPYVPGLLSYREGPACCAAWEALSVQPDVLICDGQGVAHPRRLGLAAHLGLSFGVPTIGSAKSRLVGEYTEPGSRRGEHSSLVDPVSGERLGTVLRTRDNVKPLFISVGVRINLADAEAVILDRLTRYRLPEPQRRADRLVGRHRREVECA